jgi:rubrerythrin
MNADVTANHEGHDSGHGRLRQETTVADMLETALMFEETARDLYRALAPQVSKRIRWLIADLAEEEQRHFDLFNDLLDRDDLQAQIAAEIARPSTDAQFADCIQAPDLGEQPDDRAVLAYAIGREHAAMEQYRELAETTQPGPIRDVFRYLTAEEALHKAELEKIHHELLHRNGA